jgi:hypothetical protein
MIIEHANFQLPKNRAWIFGTCVFLISRLHIKTYIQKEVSELIKLPP